MQKTNKKMYKTTNLAKYKSLIKFKSKLKAIGVSFSRVEALFR